MVRVVSAIVAAAPWLVTGALADYDPIAGYVPVSDVVEHSELDLDMQDIETGTDLLTEAGFEDAWTAYSVGGNSEKTDSIRTIRGFSTSAQEKLTSEKWFDIYEAYWNAPDYADLFTVSACNGTDDFADVEPVVRAEGCLKGAQYQNVWMYVIHELEDAVNDCNNGDLTANDGGPHAWDEGWAFYAGSAEGTQGSGDGFMLYALAEKRCENFGTCTGDEDGNDASGTAAVNYDLLELFEEGQGKLLTGECDEAEDIKDEIVDLMTVPLLQGLLRYLYLADPSGGNGADKEAAELWAFSASILPRIHECDPDLAVTIRANTELTSSDAPVSEGYVFLKERLESVYSCLGISCGQVGGLLIGDDAGEYFSGFEPCSDGDSDGLSQGEEAAVSIAVIAVVGGMAIFACLFIRRKKKQKTAQSGIDSDLGGFGAKTGAHTGTL